MARVSPVSPAGPTAVAGVAVAALLAVAMRLQNTMARRLAVSDLTTTVLTMALTGIAADARRRPAATTGRRRVSRATRPGSRSEPVGALGGPVEGFYAFGRVSAAERVSATSTTCA